MDEVTWRLEIPRGWGERLDPAWLPTGSTEAWRKVFAGEDLAGRFFTAGGGGLPWKDLAAVAAQLGEVVGQYRAQWWCAETVAAGCPVAADAHLAALGAPSGLRAPRRTAPDGRWRVCVLDTDGPATVAEFPSIDPAEGAACAHRTAAVDRAWWVEPVTAGAAPARSAEPGWVPRVDTELRSAAFATEDSVADLTRAAATGHTGPDVLDTTLVCLLGEAAHHMIREYRALFAAAWTDLESCVHADAHEADAEQRLAAVPDTPDHGPGGRWNHVRQTVDGTRAVGRYPSREAAAAAVAAGRATDGTTGDVLRWAEPTVRTATR